MLVPAPAETPPSGLKAVAPEPTCAKEDEAPQSAKTKATTAHFTKLKGFFFILKYQNYGKGKSHNSVKKSIEF